MLHQRINLDKYQMIYTIKGTSSEQNGLIKVENGSTKFEKFKNMWKF
jgi:hypothetical protein